MYSTFDHFSMRPYSFTPIRVLLIFLAILSLFAVASLKGSPLGIWLLAASHLLFLFSAIRITSSLIDKFSASTKSPPENQYITIFILFLLFAPMYPWWAFVLLGIGTESTRRILRASAGPVFNPAGIALLASAVVGFPPTWWGTSFSPRFDTAGISISLAAFLTFPIAGYVAWRYRKIPIAIAAAVGFSVFSFLLFRSFPLFPLLEGTLAFFFLVMATEPKTSPSGQSDQIIFGGIIGITLAFGLFFHIPEASLLALFLGNVFRHREYIAQKIFASNR